MADRSAPVSAWGKGHILEHQQRVIGDGPVRLSCSRRTGSRRRRASRADGRPGLACRRAGMTIDISGAVGCGRAP